MKKLYVAPNISFNNLNQTDNIATDTYVSGNWSDNSFVPEDNW